MHVGRAAVVKLVALCLALAPGAAIAQQVGSADAPAGARVSHRPNSALSKVIIYGSIGAIVGALGSLRVRRGGDDTAGE